MTAFLFSNARIVLAAGGVAVVLVVGGETAPMTYQTTEIALLQYLHDVKMYRRNENIRPCSGRR